MSHPSLSVLKYLLSIVLLTGCLPSALAASPPTLFTMTSGKAEVLAQGAQKSFPIQISENSAFDAVFQGGMWFPNPAGGRIYAKYQRHIIHANGTWTWVGTVETVHGEQSVVLTFGKGSVFGLVPQASGYPLRIVSNAQGTHVVETFATAMARSAKVLRVHSASDYVIPPKGGRLVGGTSSVDAAASVPVQANASGPVIIDVMVVYTSGYVSEMGSQSVALTRIQNLVDITNAAYANSGVNQQIRLVNVAEVNYPDNTSNQSALDDITGIDENGHNVPIPTSLQKVASLRDQYGADLVTLIRSYDNTVQGGCGVGWLIGGNQSAIVPSEQKPYGYNVVSDGSNGGYFCLDTTFAHELGHNMGSAHDRANASEPGAYSYSYGYLGNGTNGFSTIMAYGTTTTTPLAMFSNPNVSTCQNTPCGVTDGSSSSADNAHSLNNTATLIAAFEPPKIAIPPAVFTYAHNDVNGDHKSDLTWRSNDNKQLAYWIMNGTQLAGSLAIPTSTAIRPVATGDFNGDGMMDVIWMGGASLYMWVGNGSTFTNVYMRPYPVGWTIVGTGDLDGDGATDLVWTSGSQIAEWLMNGTNFKASYKQTLATGWRYLMTGDFDGDGRTDLLLTNGSVMQMWTNFDTGSFKAVSTQAYPSYGWTILEAGDVNGDGKADLLWRDTSHTYFAYWIMDGSQVTKTWKVAVTPEWRFRTAGDFNSDGLLDLIWYNSTQVVMWPGNSAGVYKGSIIHAYPTGWTMLH